MDTSAFGRSGPMRGSLLLGAATLAVGLPSAVSAQDGEPEEELAQPAGDYQEDADTGNMIVVTATKREQTLQDTPVAVSVATAEQIERGAIRDIADLQTIVPSLRVTPLQSTANTNFIIRGFGNGANNAGIEPSVGVFIDGVYRSRTAAQVNDMPNVQRVEVLRGPQSTLFGKNASAGVISIVTQAPQFDFGGSVEATYGNYDATVLKGYVTGPVSDAVALSLAGGYHRRDGYNIDLGTGDRTNDRNRWFVRGQMLIEPSPDLKIRLIADYDSLDENCCGVINLRRSGATDAIEALGGHVPDYTDPYANVVYNNFNSTNEIENYGFSGQIDYNLGLLRLTSITSYRKSNAVTAQDPDFSSADLIYPIAADVSLDTFTQELRASAQFADMFSVLLGAFYINENVDQTGQLKWGAQARDYANLLVTDLSGGALSLPMLEQTFGALEGDPAKYAGSFFRAHDGFDETYGLDSEALSIFGQVDVQIADGLTLTLGGNYTRDRKNYSANIASSDVFSTIDFDRAGLGGYTPLRYQLLYQGGLAQQVGGALGLDRAATASEIAGFAGANPTAYAAIDAAVAGYAAANADNPAANPLNPLKPYQYLPPFVPVPNAVEDGHIADNDFSYTIRLAYDVSPNVNIYASYATGFKAASVNLSRDSRPLASDAAALGAAGLLQVNQSFGTRFAEPEESSVYEFGAKGNWGRTSANLAIFKQDIEGFQSNVFTGSGFALANAGKQSTFGVEFEGNAQLVPGFVVNLGVTYLDPKYDSFVQSAFGDISGMKPAGIPEWTFVIGGQYDYELGNGDELILNASFHHESEVQIVDGLSAFYNGDTQAAIDAAKPFTREVDDLSASLTYAMENGLEFAVWGRNLLNDRYLLQIFDSVAQNGSISGYTNEPRTWGGTVRFKW